MLILNSFAILFLGHRICVEEEELFTFVNNNTNDKAKDRLDTQKLMAQMVIIIESHIHVHFNISF